MMDAEKSSMMIERGTIEIAPLAYMRGRTLNDSFVILTRLRTPHPSR